MVWLAVRLPNGGAVAAAPRLAEDPVTERMFAGVGGLIVRDGFMVRRVLSSMLLCLSVTSGLLHAWSLFLW